MKNFIEALKKWKNFSGKTDRKSFWLFFLILNLFIIPVGIIEHLINIENLNEIYFLLVIVPYFTIGFRRLNDAGFNRWLFLIPFVGLILATFPSKKQQNTTE